MASTTGASAGRKSPIPVLLVGILAILFWVLASLLQIQTSEAFILRGAIVSFVPNWGILVQPADLAQGHLSPDMAKAVMWGWGIELLFLICIAGYEIAHESVRHANEALVPWFRTGLIVLIAFDGWTDFQYGQLASGFWGQVAFAGIMSFIVAFFGVVGFRLVEYGISEWSR